MGKVEIQPTVDIAGRTAFVTIKCVMCGTVHHLVVPAEKLLMWAERPAHVPVHRFWSE